MKLFNTKTYISLGLASIVSTALLGSSDPARLEEVLRFIQKRNDDLRSIGLRTRDGRLVLAVGSWRISSWPQGWSPA